MVTEAQGKQAGQPILRIDARGIAGRRDLVVPRHAHCGHRHRVLPLIPEPSKDTLHQLQTARNELVHEIYRNPRFDLLSPSGASDLLAYLDEQYSQAEEWAEIFRVQSLKEILLISGLFDVKVDGDTVWYRSKRELRDSPLNENLTGLSLSVIRHA